jgi:transposase
MEITTIGLDLAKSIFQVHAVDAAGVPVVRKAVRRAQVLPFFAKLPGAALAWKRAARRIGRSAAARDASAQAGAPRHGRRSQPDGASSLGDHDTRRHLSLAYGRPGRMTA